MGRWGVDSSSGGSHGGEQQPWLAMEMATPGGEERRKEEGKKGTSRSSEGKRPLRADVLGDRGCPAFDFRLLPCRLPRLDGLQRRGEARRGALRHGSGVGVETGAAGRGGNFCHRVLEGVSGEVDGS